MTTYQPMPELPALMPQKTEGFASICAYHNALAPRSKEAAEAFALFHGLQASHGICPTCALRIETEIRAIRTQREQPAAPVPCGLRHAPRRHLTFFPT